MVARRGLTLPGLLQYHRAAGPLLKSVMRRIVPHRFLACALVLSMIVVGGLASAQSLSHETQHAHHQKATHGTVLCSWMCAAGQVLDATGGPNIVERAPIAWVEVSAPEFVKPVSLSTLPSRGPPIS